MISETKKKIVAVTGMTGVIGSILSEELSSEYFLVDLYHKAKHGKKKFVKKHIFIDLSKKRNILKALEEASPDVVVHMAAITHIDACEVDRKNGKSGIVWKVNVEGTKIVSEFCAKNKIPLIFLSTECVFDGRKEFFEENDKKKPINWYGVTKNEAEEIIFNSGAKFAVIRSVVAYHHNDKAKTIYGKILKGLKSGSKLFMVDDQLFTPTYTYDIVKAVHKVIDKNLRGVFHVAPQKNLSPYSFALLIAKKNKILSKNVIKTKLVNFYGQDKASLRLKNSSLLAKKSIKELKFRARIPDKVI